MSVRWQVAPVFRRLDSAVNNKSVVHRGVSTARFSVVFRHSHNSGQGTSDCTYQHVYLVPVELGHSTVGFHQISSLKQRRYTGSFGYV